MSPVSRLVPCCSAYVTISYCDFLLGDPLGPGTTPQQVHHPPTARVVLSGRLSLITLAQLQVYLHRQLMYSSITGWLSRYVVCVPRNTPDWLNILTQCTHISDNDLSLSSASLHSSHTIPAAILRSLPSSPGASRPEMELQILNQGINWGSPKPPANLDDPSPGEVYVHRTCGLLHFPAGNGLLFSRICKIL